MGLLTLLVVVGAGIIALVFALVSFGKINAFLVENDKVNELSEIIHKGAMAFLSREYKWLTPFVIIIAVLLWLNIGMPSAVSFVLGAFCSGLAGYFGMKVARLTERPPLLPRKE